jgi:hypothetical protein
MKHLLSVSIRFFKNNGLFGVSLSKISQLRSGADDYGKNPHTKVFSQTSSSTSETSLNPAQIDTILNDDQISEEQKKPFRNLREDPMFGDSEKLYYDRLRKSLIAKTQHPVYSKIKGKIPYAILSPFTFGELARLATYRVAGFTSAPLTIGGFIGLSMPCAVTFSMLEMYAPDKFKFPCKCAKWTGGIVFYGVCSSVDYVTSGIETKKFGQPLPIDAPQLMGTLPNTNDLDELKKLKQLARSLTEKSNPLNMLGED